MKFERIVEFSSAYNKQDPDPAKDYGISVVRVQFILKGEHSAVTFLFGTNWVPEHIQRQRHDDGKNCAYFQLEPQGFDLGYHADTGHPISEYQSDREPGPGEFLINPILYFIPPPVLQCETCGGRLKSIFPQHGDIGGRWSPC